jgi:hypothetical protein
VLNSRLFHHIQKADSVYMVRLAVLCLAGLAAAVPALRCTSGLELWQQGLISLLVCALVAALAWQIFNIRPLFSGVLGRLNRRFA